MRRSVMIAAAAVALVLFSAAPAAAATPWTIVPTPPVAAGGLSSISCTSASSCEAVGGQGPEGEFPLAEQWDGTSWTIQDTPAPATENSWLSGVSCVSPASCVAVGGFAVSPETSFPFAETWDGSTWTMQTVPTPSGAYSVSLGSISCTSAAMCEAVGSYTTLVGGDATHTFAEAWDGSTWTIQTVPSFSVFDGLAAVSCVSAVRCTAVGSGSRVPGGLVVEVWNGLQWVFRKVPLPSGTGTLNGISCTSADSCTAVGQISGSGPLAEHWNGTTWALQAIPGPPGAPPNSGLSGISCTSPISCTAVGSYENKNSTDVAQADVYYRGTWRNQNTAAPASSKALNGVFCFTATACTAVGLGGQSGAALVEQK